MSQSQQERPATGGPRTYSHWRRPTGGGLGPLTVAGTGLLLGGGVVTVVMAVFVKSLLGAVVAALLAAVALSATTVPVAGRPMVVRAAGWVAYRRSRSTRRYLYAAGVVAPVGTGRHQLPGIASGTRLWDCVDAYDQPFALIQATATHDFSVAVRCSSTGAELVDQVAVDRQVARWGEFLAQLGLEEHLVGCSVTVQTAPDPGVALTQLLAAQRGQDPPALAVQVMAEIADTYPQASAVVDTVVQFTWSGIAEGRKRPVAEMAADIGASVPELLQLLVGTGAGTRPRAMGSAAVSAFVRRAYDPAQSTAIAALGDAGAGIDWDDAGPVSHTAHRDSYTHDSGHTVVWSMSRPPRGVVHSDVLHDLLAPHDRIAVKRVTLLYRPFDPKLAADTVDHDVQAADFKTGQQNRVTARDRADSLAAAQAAEEEAAGAGLVAFGMLVSATVTDPADLPRARATVQNRLAGPARIALRPCYGYQPAAFAATLPTGIVLPRHTLLGRVKAKAG